MRCGQLGATLESTNDGHLPTTVAGTRALRGPVRVPGTISSQYLTSLLTIAPLIEGGLSIEVEGELTSKPYVDLTLDEMAKFGVQVENQRLPAAGRCRRRRTGPAARRGRRRLGGLVFRRAGDAARRDASRSATWARAPARGTTASSRCAKSSVLPCSAQAESTSIDGPRRARAAFDGDVDMTSMPDVAPTLMMLAPFLARPTRLTGLATLRVKECDRIAAPTRELRKLGVTVEEGPDWMRIEPLPASRARDARGSGNRDLSRPPHRHVLRRARIAPAGPADPRSGLRGQDLSELLARLAAGRRRSP